jgi:hypothetical protein
MKSAIFIPSYKRPKVKSLEYLKNNKEVKVFICIDKSEEKEYKNNNNLKDNEKIIIMDKGIQGNISRVRNWIIDNYLDNYDVICIMDDDLSYIGYFENGERKRLDSSLLNDFIYKYSLLCKEWGYMFWGLNLNTDDMNYREFAPFSTLSSVLAPVSFILKGNQCRYDEKIPLKEDYDFFLQNIAKYKGVLRVNKFHYLVKQGEQEGGCAYIRNSKEEKRQLELLQEKWGSKVVKMDKNRGLKRNNKRAIIDYNPIIKVPIKGI